MSKGITNELEITAGLSEIIPRMLVTVYASDTDIFRFVANSTRKLTFDGDIYEPADIKRGEIKTTIEGDKEQVSLTMSNRWREWSMYLAQNGKSLKYKKCVIQEVYLEHLEEGSVWLFEGVLNSLKTTMTEFSCTVERDVIDFTQESPIMGYGPTCQYIYKDGRCRSTSSLARCDGTITNCIERGNVTRYGGHVSIPREMVVKT